MKRILSAFIVLFVLATASLAATEALQIDALWSGLMNSTNGKAYSGAIIATFAADGSTPKAVWENKEKTQPSALGKAQFTLDSSGAAEVFGDGVYVIKVYAPTDTLLSNPLRTLDGLTYINNELLVDEAFDVDHNADYTHIVYESIANLRASTLTPFDGQVVKVTGYYSGTENQKWFFRWNASSTTTDDSGINIKTLITTGRWERLYDSGPVSVVWFGAHPAFDDFTDDTAIIQSVIDYFDGSPGIVYLPTGMYRVTDTLTIAQDDLGLIGDGPGETILSKITDYGSTILLDINLSQISDNQLRNFKIEHGSTVSTLGAEIQINAGVRTDISDVSISGAMHIGIESNGCLNLYLNRVHITGTGTYAAGRYGIKFMPRPAGYGGSPGNNGAVSITNSTFNTFWLPTGGDASFRANMYIESADGIYVTNTRFGGATIANVYFSATVATHNIAHVSFDNCFFDLVPNRDVLTVGSGALSFESLRWNNCHFGGSSSSVTAMEFQGNPIDIIVSNSRFTEWEANCIQMQDTPSKIVLSGNIFNKYNGADSGDNCGIFATGSWTGFDLIVTGNIFRPTTTTGTGVKISGGSAIIISNNRIKNNTTGVLIESGATNYMITNNILTGNTATITDNGGAVAKLVQDNLL